MDYVATGVIVNMTDDEQATALANGEVSACVNGTWRAETAQNAWGDNYAASKLPTYTLAGSQVQMSSFSGCKLVGVNAYSDQIGWSMLLAEYLTNEQAQIGRFNERGLGPSNIAAASSPEVQANPAIAALAAQADYATPQRVGGNYWTPAQTLGEILTSGNPDGTDLQTLLDTAVEGIEAPVV
jgi:arabinogalactan oligomer/maltooligosaccharide transport system substrate-binding protein